VVFRDDEVLLKLFSIFVSLELGFLCNDHSHHTDVALVFSTLFVLVHGLFGLFELTCVVGPWCRFEGDIERICRLWRINLFKHEQTSPTDYHFVSSGDEYQVKGSPADMASVMESKDAVYC
jgi:hypothetical protein